jgi:hypothetical protein
VNLLKKAMRWIQDVEETRFARGRRLIPCGDSGLIRLEPSVYRGPGVTLRDGLSVHPGARVAEVHLDSRKVAELFGTAPPMRARIAVFRRSEAAFAWIAQWMVEDAQGREIVAVRSTTLLDREMRHVGFEVLPLPVWPWIFVGCYMQWLSYLYRAETSGLRERDTTSLLKRMIPRQAWMSREDFLRKYSKDQGA